MDLWTTIAERIAAASGAPFTVRERWSVGGGCIHESWVVTDGTVRWFVKTNDAAAEPLFEAEADGLAALAESGTVRVPRPLAWGRVGGTSFLAMEYLELGGHGADEALGRQLAALHRREAPRFGWRRDNFIGATPQRNDFDDDWTAFLRERRLGYQLDLAAQKQGGSRLGRAGEELLERMPALFRSYRPRPSLLHGDLWGGNAGVTRGGEPVIFDPAVYCGDREAELAMTELFGGFSARFYAAYGEAWPLDEGYAVRKQLYNLYHILNHFNLFGGGYAGQAEVMMERLLTELR
jgi:fructosamine-3-kinase